eukprot:1268240-Pleurochrysis_carterae.AAC.1
MRACVRSFVRACEPARVCLRVRQHVLRVSESACVCACDRRPARRVAARERRPRHRREAMLRRAGAAAAAAPSHTYHFRALVSR